MSVRFQFVISQPATLADLRLFVEACQALPSSAAVEVRPSAANPTGDVILSVEQQQSAGGSESDALRPVWSEGRRGGAGWDDLLAHSQGCRSEVHAHGPECHPACPTCGGGK